MKHIWYIEDKTYELGEGYVDDNYKDNDYCSVYKEENNMKSLVYYGLTENIFDNKETAVNIFNGMLLIQIRKLEKYIDDCQNKIDKLTDKLIIKTKISNW